MKSLVLSLIVFAQTVIAGPQIDVKAQREIEPLMDYTGFWQDAGGDVIQIFSDENFETKTFQTKVLGVNLRADFAYNTSSYADNDNPIMEINGDRVESLMEKTLRGKKRLIQFDFLLKDANTLNIAISGDGKNVTQVFKRMTDRNLATRLFKKIQLQRAEQIILEEQSHGTSPACESSPPVLHVHSVIERRLNDCLIKLVETGKIDINKENLLHAAAKQNDVAIIKYLLGKGADVNGRDEQGYLPLFYVFDGGFRALGIGEHGFVGANGNRDEAVRLLLSSGAKIENDLLTKMAIGLADAATLDLALKQKPDMSNFKEVLLFFANDYRERWGDHKLELLSKFFSLLSPEQKRETNDYWLTRSWVIEYMDQDGLATLLKNGYTFSDADISAAEEHISKLEKDLSTRNSYQYKLSKLDKITNLQNSIKFLRQITKK